MTTIANAADVDALRQALGYGRISLIAGSYGSHLAIALMRYHPQSIERAIIWGMEGPDDTYDIPDGILQSLKAQAAAAEADPRLRGSSSAGRPRRCVAGGHGAACVSSR